MNYSKIRWNGKHGEMKVLHTLGKGHGQLSGKLDAATRSFQILLAHNFFIISQAVSFGMCIGDAAISELPLLE